MDRIPPVRFGDSSPGVSALYETPPTFWTALTSVFGVMTTLFLISLVGFIGVRRKIVSDETITGMTRLLVDLVAPARLVHAMIAGLTAETLADCGIIMLAMVVLCLGGWAFAAAGTFIWSGKSSQDNRTIWALSAFQNGVYLPLTMMLTLAPADQQTLATIYIGGGFVAMVALQWTLGVFMLRGEEYRQSAKQASPLASVRGAINPPMLGILVGAVLAFVPPFSAAARGEEAPMLVTIPVRSAEILGSALAPIAMLVLGMMIGRCRIRGRLNMRLVTIPFVFRLIVSPLLMFLALKSSLLAWVGPLMALTLIIQAGTPPATALSLIARRYDGDWEVVSGVLLITYLAALATLPAWTALVMVR